MKKYAIVGLIALIAVAIAARVPTLRNVVFGTPAGAPPTV